VNINYVLFVYKMIFQENSHIDKYQINYRVAGRMHVNTIKAMTFSNWKKRCSLWISIDLLCSGNSYYLAVKIYKAVEHYKTHNSKFNFLMLPSRYTHPKISLPQNFCCSCFKLWSGRVLCCCRSFKVKVPNSIG